MLVPSAWRGVGNGSGTCAYGPGTEEVESPEALRLCAQPVWSNLEALVPVKDPVSC